MRVLETDKEIEEEAARIRRQWMAAVGVNGEGLAEAVGCFEEIFAYSLPNFWNE